MTLAPFTSASPGETPTGLRRGEYAHRRMGVRWRIWMAAGEAQDVALDDPVPAGTEGPDARAGVDEARVGLDGQSPPCVKGTNQDAIALALRGLAGGAQPIYPESLEVPLARTCRIHWPSVRAQRPGMARPLPGAVESESSFIVASPQIMATYHQM
ncbi:hypothetical protein DNJ95_09755 [Stutzerimonas kirkiae]|uniref:Uncharacterized protein n=1 Tax=Stutzerimonas kirkiae TaxID=2211392 RepID=A0A4Q9RDN1_9GAMM|nr:hypothetical protein DNJ96_06675 [Stutzerimonas kirkiae]TBV02378.1 hypothetical protein DNJ95_09755 [Stutzerimonas kirkiae]